MSQYILFAAMNVCTADIKLVVQKHKSKRVKTVKCEPTFKKILFIKFPFLYISYFLNLTNYRNNMHRCEITVTENHRTVAIAKHARTRFLLKDGSKTLQFVNFSVDNRRELNDEDLKI